MTVHFPFQNTYSALPASFFARVAPDPRGRAPADQAEPAAGRPARARSRPAGEPGRRRNPRRQRACPTAPTRSRWPMPATSSAISCRSSATAARSCSARSSTATASAATSSSRAPARRRSRAAATAAPRSARCCANTSSARRWSALGIPTTRSLAAVTTGEPVMRETVLPGAVLTRVAVEPHPRRHLPVLRRARRHRGRAPARRPRHRPPLPGRRAMAERPYRALLERVDRAPGRAGRALAAGRLHPRRDEHRQHARSSGETIDYGPCAFMDAYDPAHGVLLDRRDGPLRLRQPAAHRAVESDAARRMPAAAVRRRQGQGDRAGAGRRSATFAETFTAAYQAGLRKQDRPVHRRATATRRWCRTCSTRWRRTRPTSP